MNKNNGKEFSPAKNGDFGELVNINANQVRPNPNQIGQRSEPTTPELNNNMDPSPTTIIGNSSSTNSTQNLNKTRETVQKVYRMIKSRTTSTSSGPDVDVADEDVADSKEDKRSNTSRNSSQRSNSRQSPQPQAQSQQGSRRGSNINYYNSPRQSPSRQLPPPSTATNLSDPVNCTTGSNNNGDQTDEEESQLAKLRCPSLSTEMVSEREQRRRKRLCSDYPGLAFGLGGSVFGSDTMMRFSLIKNELYNVINGQLKRAETEVATFNRRIQLIEDDLEKSKETLGTVTTELAEASHIADEACCSREDLDSETGCDGTGNITINDSDCPSIREAKAQVKLIAEESDKIYNEVVRKLSIMEKDLEKLDEKADENEWSVWKGELRRKDVKGHGTGAGSGEKAVESHGAEITEKLELDNVGK